MKKILSLCINLLLLIISEAVPLQLIAGDRRVVKKDGATHTISKYYVVPNDFDPKNVTNSTEASQATLRMNHSLYSKSMDAETERNNQDSEKRTEAANNQTNKNNADVKSTEASGPDDGQVEVTTQASYISISTGSVNTGQSFNPDDLGNLLVEPITNSININSSVTINNSSEALQIGTSFIIENETVEDELDDLILTKFGTAVQEGAVQNLESFWKLIKLTIDRISDDDEFLAQIEKLTLLLNIFTNLYEAAQSQKPIEPMIDSIIDILQIPFVEKSNTGESQSQTDVSGDNDEECLRKCGLKRSKPQLDSNGTYLSETESPEASDNLKLEKLDLQRRQISDSDGDWINTSNDPVSNQVTVSNQPTNILQSQLLLPNVGVPDGFNVRSLIPPTLNHITRNNDIKEDPKSNQIIPDSAETDENTDDQTLTIESRLIDDLPRTIEDKSTQNIPWTIETIMSDDLPWRIEDKTTDNLPWHIEDKSIVHHPFTIEHSTTHTLPWTIEDRGNKKGPWKVENRADPTWTIENKMAELPITLYQSKDPSVITHGSKILLHPNQPLTGTVQSVKHVVKKPYHIYTYVINPATSLYEIPNSENIIQVKSRQSNDNLGTKLYGMSSHGGDKIVYTSKQSPSYDGSQSQFSLIEPTIDISSQISNSQLKHMNYDTSIHDASNGVNPSTLISKTQQYDYQPKYLVEFEPETNHKPALLQTNTLPIDSNSDQKNEEPEVSEVGSHPGVLLPNVPSNPVESRLNINNNGPVSTVSASSSADNSDVNPDIGDTEPIPYNLNINLNHKQQINAHPGLISKILSHSEYTNLPAEYEEPVYVDQTHQHPGLISSSASSNSEYTNISDDSDEPTPVFGGHTDKHPGLISSQASSSSEYTNLPDEYDEPVYDVQTHQVPGLISSSYSKYTNVADDFVEPKPAYGGQTHIYPGIISKASDHSEYKNLPNDYTNLIANYGQHTATHPDLITKVNHYPEYATVVDDYDEPIAVYGEEIHKHPSVLSKASSHSEYTNLLNDDNNPTDDYEEDADRYPVHIQTRVNDRPTENKDNLLVSYHPYGHTVNYIQPSLIAHLQGIQPTGVNYLKHLKLKLAPTYRLFTLDNLLKLRDVILKTIEVNGNEPDVYDNIALMNLRKIIKIILLLAEHLEEPEGSIEWYEKIFYNTQKNRHPLEIYVYNLIRQRWLHELMLVLHNNDFNLKILQNPRIFSFLGSWQFPHYVQNFIETEKLIKNNFDVPEVFDQTFSTQHGLQDKFATHTYDDLLEEVPEDLESYVTNNVINSYKTPNAGIVLSIAGVEAEPDANAIIQILQKYLHYKSFIEKQENVIIRDNKVEMLKKIILFLREKGYDAFTIEDLIRKLYTAVYSTEGKGCQTHHTNFVKNMYDVILPVLRRSGR